jgi:hypothetical protein
MKNQTFHPRLTNNTNPVTSATQKVPTGNGETAFWFVDERSQRLVAVFAATKEEATQKFENRRDPREQ